jgi:hypothetical protein
MLRPGLDGRITLKPILNNMIRGCGLDSFDAGYGPVVGSCDTVRNMPVS